jgi:gamma-glutamylcyclotransferase (GGCT)/AIG2-like uncharacterized protein YtfP
MDVIVNYKGTPVRNIEQSQLDLSQDPWAITQDSSVKLDGSKIYEKVETENHQDLLKTDQIIQYIEIVSPILTWKSINENIIENTLQKFKANDLLNYINNSTTSNHVHFSNGDIFKDSIHLVNSVMAWWYYEPVFLSMVGKWRRDNRYCISFNTRMYAMYGPINTEQCKHINSENYNFFLGAVGYNDSLTELHKLVYFFQGSDHSSRYSALNLMNLINNIGTIEVRLKHGSSDGEENKNFVLLLGNFFHSVLVKGDLVKRDNFDKPVEEKQIEFFNLVDDEKLKQYWNNKILQLKNMDAVAQSGGSHSEYLFSYGSNGLKQLSERLSRPKWNMYPATLLNHVRIFAGYSKKWEGAVSSVHPSRNGKVNGIIFEIQKEELEKLDKFEKGYRREIRKIGEYDCHVYFKTNTAFECMPSKKYMDAIRKMLDDVPRSSRKQIIIRSVSDDGKIIVHKNTKI